jgi:hypothetical protein
MLRRGATPAEQFGSGRRKKTEVMKMKRIPLIEELRSEIVRLSSAAGGESGEKSLRLVDRVEEALWCFLGAAKLWSDEYPEQAIRKKLKELGLLE